MYKLIPNLHTYNQNRRLYVVYINALFFFGSGFIYDVFNHSREVQSVPRNIVRAVADLFGGLSLGWRSSHTLDAIRTHGVCRNSAGRHHGLYLICHDHSNS